MTPKPLAELVDPGWAEALAPVADRIAALGEFLRAETAAGRPYLPSGDRVLRDVAAAWHAQLRGRDPLGRIGGEEFVVVCQDTSLEQAMLVAGRLREALHALRFDDVDTSLQVSVSIGAASYRQGETREELLASADAALYRAKQRGRDRIET